MGTGKIDSAEITNMTNTVTNYSSPIAQNTTELFFQDTQWSEWLGIYYDIIPLKAMINKKAMWTVGKGYKADKHTKKILDKIRGNGVDTFNLILQNAVRVYTISEAGFFAEIIRSVFTKKLINLKPLNPSSMKVIANKNSMITGFEQFDGDKKVNKFKLKEIFYLPYNRIADSIHGESVVKTLKDTSEAYKEAKKDMRIVFHRYVKPLIISVVDTDNPEEIKDYKTKLDRAVELGENLVVPKGTLDSMERMAIPQFATLDPLPWIASLERDFLIADGVPAVILGSSEQGDKEAVAKILYLAWQQVIESNQMFLEEQCKSQLGITIELEFPASLEKDLQEDKSKERNLNNMESGIGKADGGTKE